MGVVRTLLGQIAWATYPTVRRQSSTHPPPPVSLILDTSVFFRHYVARISKLQRLLPVHLLCVCLGGAVAEVVKTLVRHFIAKGILFVREECCRVDLGWWLLRHGNPQVLLSGVVAIKVARPRLAGQHPGDQDEWILGYSIFKQHSCRILVLAACASPNFPPAT